MDWSLWLNRLIKYIGVLAFAVSLVNLIIIVISRRVKIRLSEGLIRPHVSTASTFFLEVVVSNSSGLPISINQVSVKAGDEFIPCQTRQSFRMETRSSSPGGRSVFFTSAFPVHLGAYESQRMSIQFPRRTKLAKLLHLQSDRSPEGLTATPDSSPVKLALCLHTSRGLCKLPPVSCDTGSFSEWVKTISNTSGY